ncbi:hypothetical protein [Kitasatospora sp. NPDC002965]|uniref:hypothetical protein n=1 Tax=Kitasatospora sp. NPDC002965 TaxID=3154775 RepID=UPI00339DC578
MSDGTVVPRSADGPIRISAAALPAMARMSSDEREVLLMLLTSSLNPDTSAVWVKKALAGLRKKNLIAKTDHGYVVSSEVAS